MMTEPRFRLFLYKGKYKSYSWQTLNIFLNKFVFLQYDSLKDGIRLNLFEAFYARHMNTCKQIEVFLLNFLVG